MVEMFFRLLLIMVPLTDMCFACKARAMVFGQVININILLRLIDYMITNNKLDPFAVSYNGLSAGGDGTWGMMFEHPTYTASDIPMSAASLNFTSPDLINKMKFLPVWNIQGGKDGAPAPYTAHQVRDAIACSGCKLYLHRIFYIWVMIHGIQHGYCRIFGLIC